MPRKIELDIEAERRKQKALCDKIVPQIMALFYKQEREKKDLETYEIFSILMTCFATILINSAKTKNLEVVRQLMNDVRTQLLNGLAAEGWE